MIEVVVVISVRPSVRPSVHRWRVRRTSMTGRIFITFVVAVRSLLPFTIVSIWVFSWAVCSIPCRESGRRRRRRRPPATDWLEMNAHAMRVCVQVLRVQVRLQADDTLGRTMCSVICRWSALVVYLHEKSIASARVCSKIDWGCFVWHWIRCIVETHKLAHQSIRHYRINNSIFAICVRSCSAFWFWAGANIINKLAA